MASVIRKRTEIIRSGLMALSPLSDEPKMRYYSAMVAGEVIVSQRSFSRI
jgi:hypothetical protein